MWGRRPSDAVPGKGFEIMVGTLMYVIAGAGGYYYVSTRYDDSLLGIIVFLSVVILIRLFYRATQVFGGSDE